LIVKTHHPSRQAALTKAEATSPLAERPYDLRHSTVALAVADTAMARGWRVWWITATDGATLTGGILEVLAQLDAPESVIRLVQEGNRPGAVAV
jgi:hypothetical protein